MNIFTLEEWAMIETVVMVIFGILTLVCWVFSVYFYLNRSSWDYSEYDTMPAWLLFLSGSLLTFIICTGCYYNAYCERPLVNTGISLHKHRVFIEYQCRYDQSVGCANLWSRYRADSTWLEHRLNAIKTD